MCFRMSLYVAPACILYDPEYEYFEAAGYGQTGVFQEKANILIKVNLQLLKQNECKDYYDKVDDSKLERGIVEEQFCAKSSYYGSSEMDTW